MTADSDNEAIAAEVANLAFKWFQLHADQRLKVFNFFLLIAGICIAGFFTAMQAKIPFAASLISLVLFIVAVCFNQLDLRTAQLVEIGEDYLREFLRERNKKLDSANVNLIERADNRGCHLSYRQVFNILFVIFGLLGMIGAIFPWFAPTLFGPPR